MANSPHLINDFSLVIGGKLHSEYLGFSLLVANYSRNIPFFLPWQPGFRQTHTLCSLNIPNNSLYNASYYMCRKITSHWQPLFSKKMAAAASFSIKLAEVIFLQNWHRQPHFPTKLAAAARIWQNYWRLFWHGLDIGKTINMILYHITFGLCFSLILCLSLKILQECIKEYWSIVKNVHYSQYKFLLTFSI